ncbi:MAG: Hsp20/alpha crystallin family protein [Verrucomicrobiota bacterium]
MIQPVYWNRGFNWNPLGDLDWFERHFNHLLGPTEAASSGALAVNVWTTEDGVTLATELPGVDPDDLSVSVENGLLVLEGERKPHEAPEEARQVLQERSHGTFRKTLRLPFEVEESEVTARLKNGTLRIVLPRKAETKPKKINVTNK